MRILRNTVKRAFFALCPPARRLRNQRDALRAEHDALCAEIQRLEVNVANAKYSQGQGSP